MIVGTNTNCKIKDITITNSTAIINLLFFANLPTVPAKGFKIYLQDKDLNDNSIIKDDQYERSNIKQSLVELNNNIYWIDNYNYKDTSLNNVNINKYKEVRLTVDITNNNQSKILENRWVRECYIHLIDIDSQDRKICWSSDLLTLISDRLISPRLKSFSHFEIPTHTIGSDKLYTIHVLFTLYYESELDFNYFNNNFYYICNIKQADTGKLLETIEQQEDKLPLEKEIVSNNAYYSKPITIEVLIKNKSSETVLKFSKTFIPTKKLSNTYIKTKDGVKKITAVYIKKDMIETEDASWIAQTNFNNIAIKFSDSANVPTLKIFYNAITAMYKIVINPNLNNKDYCVLSININGERYNTLRLTGDYPIEIPVSSDNIPIELSGYYVISKYKEELPTISFFLTPQTLCSERTVCSEDTYCNDITIQGGNS